MVRDTDHPGRAPVPSQRLLWLVAAALIVTIVWVLVHAVMLAWLLYSR